MSKRGRKQPEFDNQSENDLFSELPVQDMPQKQPDKPAFLPPDSVKPLVKKIEQEVDTEWERLDAQGIHTGSEIRRRIGEAALSAEDIEGQEVREIKAKAKKTRRSQTKDRQHLGPRQQNIADGDARVKTEYELLGQDPSPYKKRQ